MLRIRFPELIVVAALSMTGCGGDSQSKPAKENSPPGPETPAGATETLAARIATVLPTPQEERWLQVPWRMDLVQARAEAQRSGRPLFLWINEGHPLGCV